MDPEDLVAVEGTDDLAAGLVSCASGASELVVGSLDSIPDAGTMVCGTDFFDGDVSGAVPTAGTTCCGIVELGLESLEFPGGVCGFELVLGGGEPVASGVVLMIGAAEPAVAGPGESGTGAGVSAGAFEAGTGFLVAVAGFCAEESDRRFKALRTGC